MALPAELRVRWLDGESESTESGTDRERLDRHLRHLATQLAALRATATGATEPTVYAVGDGNRRWTLSGEGLTANETARLLAVAMRTTAGTERNGVAELATRKDDGTARREIIAISAWRQPGNVPERTIQHCIGRVATATLTAEAWPCTNVLRNPDDETSALLVWITRSREQAQHYANPRHWLRTANEIEWAEQQTDVQASLRHGGIPIH